ncbi:undecaprenyldiphospho-muramoylpentapeptide beta-N-acetylglucosaminyltransferase [Candidatus Falkowbacteria bacterium]|nr:MAG: undecaprenyldiphospho-muramoylpentapeptide beta-N-acetylglucosaminyltransferase [Candidatus Falkowbacteria bacterium]
MGYNKTMKILFTGGGTGGPVTPLLALIDSIRNNPEFCNAKFLWIGTEKGIEKEMVFKENIAYKSIKCGKLRRYFSWKNLIDPFFIFYGILQSFLIIKKWKPSIVVSAGGYVSAGVIWSAWLLRIPILIHQQDLRPGLANRLMAPFAKIITVTFEKSLDDYGKKAMWTGNPGRNKLKNFKIDKRSALQKLGLHDKLPVILILGGGTGAEAINDLVKESMDELIKFTQVLHLTGKGKSNGAKHEIKNYRQFDFLHTEGLAKAFTVADIVVSRAGMGALTELSLLGKPAIIIPIPDSHQEDNARVFKDNEAALVLDQKILNRNEFIKNIKSLLNNFELKDKYSGNIGKILKNKANEKIIKIIWKLVA